jgi:hypothetical protein
MSLLPQPGFELLQRLHPRQFEAAICAGHIEQDRLHSRISGSHLVHRVHIAHVQALGGACLHGSERGCENFRMGLLDSNDS